MPRVTCRKDYFGSMATTATFLGSWNKSFAAATPFPQRASEAAECLHDLVDDRVWDDHGDIPRLVVFPDHQVRVIAFAG